MSSPCPEGRRTARRAFPLALAILVFLVACQATGVVAAGPPAEPVRVYFARVLQTDAGVVPVHMLPPPDMTPERGALELLVQGPPAGCGVDGMIPDGTRVLGLEISGDGLATVDFSKELLEQSYGSLGEALLIGSIVNTLAQFPSVERVWILVEGQPPGSLGGHVDLTEPMGYNPDWVLKLSLEDVRGHWSEGYVRAFYLTGMVSGYPDGSFIPEGLITREEFVKLLVLAAGLEPLVAETPTFADVETGRWSSGYIEAAVAAGIVRPDDYGTHFGPAVRLSRREMAVLLVRAAGQEALATSLTGAELPYTDVAGLPGWARGFIGAVTQLGLMNGYPDGTFQPAGTTKRSEALTVLSRFLGFGGGPIVMVTPRAGSTVGDRVLVMGVAQVFEATVQVRVKDAAGATFRHVYATATGGAPDFGIFAALLPTPDEGAGDALTVEAYEISAKDGSEIHLVSRAVQRSQ